MYPEPIQKLAALFSRLPGIGPRMAARLAFHLLKVPEQEAQELGEALLELHKRMRLCVFCFNPFSPSTDSISSLQAGSGQALCSICSDSGRTRDMLCVVEKESDLEALEATRAYRGLYFILGGTVGMLRKVDMKHLRIEEFKERIAEPKKFSVATSKFSEAILAMNLTTEGEATALYLERILNPLGIKTTRLGRGLPVGGELEYSDPETLKQSLENRR
ncbi:MAG: recombination mediator RecR [bacterium]|nr:recombination mediator RecR [bacterium]